MVNYVFRWELPDGLLWSESEIKLARALLLVATGLLLTGCREDALPPIPSSSWQVGFLALDLGELCPGSLPTSALVV